MNMPALFFQWGATIYVGIVSFAINVLIARSIGAKGFGEFATAMAIGSILLIVLDGGFRTLLLREVTRPTPGLSVRPERIPLIALGHLLAVACLSSVLALSWFRENLSIALATLACFVGVAMTQLVSALLRGQGRIIHEGTWQMVARSLSAVAILVMLLIGFHEPWHILATWAAASIALALILLGRYLPAVRLRLSREMYQSALPILIIDFATAVYFRSDLILMSLLGVSKEDSGNYAVAYRLIEAIILLANPLCILLFRRFRGASAGYPLPDRFVEAPAVYALVLGVGMAITIGLAAPSLVRWVYGSQYDASIELLQVLCWALVFILPNVVLTQAALAFNRERQYAMAAVVAAGANLALNLVFLPSHGVVAAAYCTVVTEFVLFSFLALALRRLTLIGRDAQMPETNSFQ
jgi:O-antigen/teichoic acid export membrane protein